jgi:hypothetical protein
MAQTTTPGGNFKFQNPKFKEIPSLNFQALDHAFCGGGGHPACRRAGRPARRINGPLPEKVLLLASSAEI